MNKEYFNELAGKIFAKRSRFYSNTSNEILTACFLKSEREAIDRFAKRYAFSMEKCRALFTEIASDLAGKSVSVTERKIEIQEWNSMAYKYLVMAGTQDQEIVPADVEISEIKEEELFELSYQAFLQQFEKRIISLAKEFGIEEKKSREFTVEYLRIISREE
jgi:hypothetical protein